MLEEKSMPPNMAANATHNTLFNNIHEKISRLWLATRNAVFW